MGMIGTSIGELTPAIGQTVLASGTVGIGQFQLGIDRAGSAVPIRIVAVAG